MTDTQLEDSREDARELRNPRLRLCDAMGLSQDALAELTDEQLYLRLLAGMVEFSMLPATFYTPVKMAVDNFLRNSRGRFSKA